MVPLSLCLCLQLIVDVADNPHPEYSNYLLHPSPMTALPSSLGQLTNLRHLRLRGCNSLQALPDSCSGLVSLANLELVGCHSMERLPEWLGQLSSLQVGQICATVAYVSLPS